MIRLKLPDLLKGLAVFFMVQVHITELFINSAGRESLVGKVSMFLGGPFAAVVFMSVMGYFIAKNKNTFSQNIFRGIKIFLLGFFLNIGLNFHLLLKITFAGWQHNVMEYIMGVDILYLAGMSIVVLAVLKTFNRAQKWASVVLLFVVAGLTGYMNEKLLITGNNYILPFIAGNYSWSYFPIFPWLAYPLAGFVYAQSEKKMELYFANKKVIVATILTSIALLVILFFKQGFNTTINLSVYYHHTFGYFLWAMGLVLLWILSVNLMLNLFAETYIVRCFCRVGKNVTLIYAIQWLIIGNISTSIYQSQDIKMFFPWVAGISTVSVFLTYLVEKIKLKVLRQSRLVDKTE